LSLPNLRYPRHPKNLHFQSYPLSQRHLLSLFRQPNQSYLNCLPNRIGLRPRCYQTGLPNPCHQGRRNYLHPRNCQHFRPNPIGRMLLQNLIARHYPHYRMHPPCPHCQNYLTNLLYP
jgi:hypothetical protein